MNSKTTDEIKKEIEALKINLNRSIDEFIKSNPDLELNINIEKQELGYIDGSSTIIYNPEIEVILK